MNKLLSTVSTKAMGILLVIAVVLGITPLYSAFAADNLGGNSDIAMSIDAFDNGKIDNNKTEYYSGEPMTVINDIQISGTDVDLSNPYMLIKIPKSEYLTRPEFVESNEALKSELKLEDDDFWYAKYTYSRVQGGFKAAYKALFNFKNELTPPGTPVKIDFEFRDSNDKVIKSASKTFTAKASDNFAPYISINSTRNKPSYQVNVSVPDVNLTTVPEKAYQPPYYVGAELKTDDPIIKAKNGAWGVYKPKNFTYRIKFDDTPLYGKFKSGYVYTDGTNKAIAKDAWDATNHILTIKTTDYKPHYSASFYMDYTGEPTNTWFNNHVELVLDEGLPTEKITTPLVNEDKTKIIHYLTQETPGADGVYKYHKSDKYRNTYKYWDYISEYNFNDNELYNVNEDLKQVGYDNDEQVEMLWKLGISNWHRNYNDNVLKVYEIKDKLDKKASSEFPYKKISNYSIGEAAPLYYENFVIPRDRILKYNRNIKTESGWNNTEQSDVTFSQKNIDSVADYLTNTGYKLIGVKQDGTEEVIKEKVVLDEKVKIHDVNKKYKHLIARFAEDNPLILENVMLQALVGTNLLDSEKAKWQKSTDNLKIEYYNYVDYLVKRATDTDKITLSSSDYMTVIKGEESAYNNSRWNGNGSSGMDLAPVLKSFKKDPKQRYMALFPKTYFYRSTSLPAGQVLKNVRDVVLLPVGVEYVKTEYSYKKGKKLDAPLEPTIIKNYKNTGKTALIYNYGDFNKEEIAQTNRNYSKVIVDPTLYTKDGLNHIEFFSVWDNEKVNVIDRYEYKDELDLDSDGNKAEILSRRVMDFTFILPLEVITTKNISLDKKNWMLESPRTDIGDDLYYKLKINNQYARAITNIKGLDTLPYKGDHTMCADENGNYLLRGEVKGLQGSDYATPLVEAVENLPENKAFLEKFDIFYSTTSAGKDIASVSGITDWKTKEQITDFAAVKNIKFVLKQGKEIAPGEFVELITHNKMEDRTSIGIDDKAINSFATNEADSRYNEANEVISRPIKYSVEGTVFLDEPKNGQLKAEKTKISDYLVQLVYAKDFTDKAGKAHKAGDVVVDHGKKLETKTDKSGHYFMNVYKRGEYQIKFVNQNIAQVFTDVNEADNKDLSNVVKIVNAKNGLKVGYSDVFTLDPYNITYNEDGSIDTTKPSLHRIRNAGLVVQTKDFTLKKIGVKKGQDFANGSPLAGVEFSLTNIGGEAFTTTAVTDAQGEISFTKVPHGTYELKEEKALAEYVKLGSVKVTVSAKGIDIAQFAKDKQTFANTRVKDGNIEIKNELIYANIKILKTDADNPDMPLAGVKFGLFETENGVAKEQPKLEAITDVKGAVLFEGVVYGDYVVKEMETLENYVLDDRVQSLVEVRKNGATIERTFTNAKIKGTVSFLKVDKDTQKPLVGVEFALKQNGDVKYSAISDELGVVYFDDVEYGKYILQEVKTLDGYILATDKTDVEIKTNKQIVDLGTIENTKRPVPPAPQMRLSQTGANIGTCLLWGVLLTLCGISFVTLRKQD